MSAPPLSASATSALQAAVILLRDTRGFMFLPMFADSERAASGGLDFLKSHLASEFYTVAWPLDRRLPISQQRVQLLANLDDAIGKLPPDTVVVLDATGSLRKDLALEVIAYVNHRREPLRSGGLRLVLCWPVPLKDELLSNAADLWSVRAGSPWLEEINTSADEHLPSSLVQADLLAKDKPVSFAMAEKLQRWQKYKNLKEADFSAGDALGLSLYQFSNSQFESAAELANAVFRSIDDQSGVFNDKKIMVDALNVYSFALQRLGNNMAALDASKTAMFNARQLAEANPAAYEPVLAVSIHNRAKFLSETGDRPGALKAALEAVNIYKRLAKTDPATYEPGWALSINNLANFLSETGDRPGALIAALEAVDVYKRLAKTNTAAHEPGLAASINNLANFLSETGDRPGALKAALEAVEVYKRLAKTNPAADEPGLAASFNNLARALSETGDHPGALKSAMKAADIYERLAKTNPAAYEPDLATSLNNLAKFLSETGDRPGALKAALEARDIYKRLAKTNPAAYEPGLAASFNNLANSLCETGDHPGALKAAQEAVGIRRRLAKANPAAYEPVLVTSINNLVKFLSETGDRPGAIEAAQEAVALYEKANDATPGAFAQQLTVAKRVWVGLLLGG